MCYNIRMSKVFINGCFDILHVAHLKMFERAFMLGENVMVGIDSDKRITKMKGSDRPINNQEDRKRMLQAIKWISKVEIFSSGEELEEMIKTFNPDFMIVGSDWATKKVIGSEFAKKLIFFERVEGISTTNIIQKIRNLN